MPTSPATRKAMTHSNAPPRPANGLRRRPSLTAYQPLRKSANSSTGKVVRSEVSQKEASNNSSTKRFQGGCSGRSRRSARYAKTTAHQSGRMSHVAYSAPKDNGKERAGSEESH